MGTTTHVKADGLPKQYKQHQRSFFGLMLVLSCVFLITLLPDVNLTLFRLLNGIAAVLPDWPLLLLTDLGNGVTLGVITLCFLIKRPELILRVIIASVLSLLLVPLLKQYFDAPRPAAVLEVLNIIGDTRLSHSFPSGHTASAFLFAGTLWFAYQSRTIKALAIAFGAIVGISRIIVGAHWPQDIMLWAIVGLLCAYAAAYCPPTQLQRVNNALMLMFLWLVLMICELEKSFDKDIIWQVLLLRWGLLFTAAALILRQYNIKQLLIQRFGAKAQ